MTDNSNKLSQYPISLLVSNKPGVLIRIALVFARRGYNMESLVVSPGHDPEFSRMTIVASGEFHVLDQIVKQLNKLIDVIHAYHHTGEDKVEREMALIKVKCKADQRTEILQISDHFKCISVDISEDTLMLETTGGTEKLDALHRMLHKYGILESVRSGKLIMARGLAET